MNPVKIAGGVLIALGFVFRAISLAYFRLKERTLPDEPLARRRFAASKRNALFLDAGFVLMGFYVLLRA